MTQEELFKKLVAHCKEYGFIFPSSEIYDGLSAVYDYGQMGVELKNNIKRYWWDSMTKLHDNIVGIDAAIFMHPRVWEASGHVGAFNDPLIDNKDSKKRYRADVLIEDWIAKQDEKIDKEVEKGRKRFGERFDEEQFRATNPRVAEITAKRNEINTRMAQALNANDLDGLRQIIIDTEIACPISGTRNWTEVRQFNLMFDTKIGSVADGANTIYLRPETAQHLRQFPQRAEDGPHEDSFRHRTNRQGFPQRNRRTAVHLSHARIRTDGDAVLRTSGRGARMVREVEGGPHAVAPGTRFRRRQLSFP